MNEPSNDWLDDLLARPDVVEDAGFTARTLAELPRSAPSPAVSATIVLGATVGASLLVLAILGGPGVTDLLLALSSFDLSPGSVSLTAFVVLGSLATLFVGLLATED